MQRLWGRGERNRGPERRLKWRERGGAAGTRACWPCKNPAFHLRSEGRSSICLYWLGRECVRLYGTSGMLNMVQDVVFYGVRAKIEKGQVWYGGNTKAIFKWIARCVHLQRTSF